MNEGILIIIATPNMEEWIIDVLLEQKDLSGFTSSYVDAHGTSGSRMSLFEQVSGRQQKVQLMVYGHLVILNGLIAQLKADLSHSDTHYILMPSIESGLI